MLAPGLRDRVARDRALVRSVGVPRAILRKPSVVLRGRLEHALPRGRRRGSWRSAWTTARSSAGRIRFHRYIFDAFLRTCDAIVVLATALVTATESQASSSAAEVAALEQDLKSLLIVLATGFDKTCQFHEKHMEDDLFRVHWHGCRTGSDLPEPSVKPLLNEAGAWFCPSRQELVSSVGTCECGTWQPPARSTAWLVAFLRLLRAGGVWETGLRRLPPPFSPAGGPLHLAAGGPCSEAPGRLPVTNLSVEVRQRMIEVRAHPRPLSTPAPWYLELCCIHRVPPPVFCFLQHFPLPCQGPQPSRGCSHSQPFAAGLGTGWRF